MIDDSLLSLLSCPETKKNLERLDEKRLGLLNDLIHEGEIVNRLQQKINHPLDGALIRSGDDTCCYPVRKGVPVLLVEELMSLRKVKERLDSIPS